MTSRIKCYVCYEDGFYVENLRMVRGNIVGTVRLCDCGNPHPTYMQNGDYYVRTLPPSPNIQNVED